MNLALIDLGWYAMAETERGLSRSRDAFFVLYSNADFGPPLSWEYGMPKGAAFCFSCPTATYVGLEQGLVNKGEGVCAISHPVLVLRGGPWQFAAVVYYRIEAVLSRQNAESIKPP